MPHVEADPDKLRQLSREIVQLAGQIEQIAQQLPRAFARADWGDPDGQKFGESLSGPTRALQRLAADMRSQYPATLQRKISALDQYRG